MYVRDNGVDHVGTRMLLVSLTWSLSQLATNSHSWVQKQPRSKAAMHQHQATPGLHMCVLPMHKNTP